MRPLLRCWFISSLILSLSILLPGGERGGRSLAQSVQPSLAGRIGAVINSDEYRISSWGVAVADASSGEMIYELNPDKLFVPGSVTKLFSGAAALVTFGADHRFITPLHRRGEIDAAGILKGELILRATGDPDLSGRTSANGRLEFTNHDHTYADFYVSQGSSAELTKTDPLDGIDDLARQVAAAGIRQVGDVLVDDRLFQRHESGGSPPFKVSPVVVNDHLIDITIGPGAKVGEPARIEFRPATSYLTFDVAVSTVSPTGGSLITVSRSGPRRFSLRGQIPINKPPTVRVVEVDDPAEFARAVLIERLAARGVRVEKSVDSTPVADALPDEKEYGQLPVIARHTSARFAESLRVILKVSHNNHAHMLPMLIGAKNGARSHVAGMRAQGQVLRGLGLDTGSFSLGDGEGGDQGDQISPRATIQLLRLMAARPDADVFRDALPVLGVDGTLAEAVPVTSPARGRVQAKTGTYVVGDPHNSRLLLRAKGLGGYVTAVSGRRLVIAIFLNNVPMRSPAETNRHGATLGHLAELIQQSL